MGFCLLPQTLGKHSINQTIPMNPLPIYHLSGSTFIKSPLNKKREPSSRHLIGSESLPILPAPIASSFNPESPGIIALPPKPAILADSHSYPAFHSTGLLYQEPQTAASVVGPVFKNILKPATVHPLAPYSTSPDHDMRSALSKPGICRARGIGLPPRLYRRYRAQYATRSKTPATRILR